MMMFSDNLNIEVNYLLVSMCGEYNSRRLRLIIEAYHLAAREQRAVVLSLLRRAVLAVDVDEGGGIGFYSSISLIFRIPMTSCRYS